jgi:hypothetical protein
MSRDRFLTAGVEIFEETGEFPTIRLVQRELEGWHDDTSARREARRLPPSLGDLEGERVVLYVRAIQRADPASPLLGTFHDGLRVAVRIYRKRDRRAAVLIRPADLIKRAGLSEFEARQALNMLAAERLVEKAGKAWEVMSAVRHYRSAKSADDYLRRKRKFERSWCRRRTFARPLDFARRILGREGLIRAVVISAAAILLASFAIWIGRELLAADSSDSPPVSRDGQPAKRHPSR